MERDMEKFNKWSEFQKQLQLKDFNYKKQKAIEDAKSHEDINARQGALRKANKLTFQFDKSGLISYGNCAKLFKPVSFIPNICQIETQDCFENRKQQ